MMLLVLKRVPWLRFDFLAKKLEKILLFIMYLILAVQQNHCPNKSKLV